jgi:hypothetical protein
LLYESHLGVAAVDVLEPNDVVLAEIAADLHLEPKVTIAPAVRRQRGAARRGEFPGVGDEIVGGDHKQDGGGDPSSSQVRTQPRWRPRSGAAAPG